MRDVLNALIWFSVGGCFTLLVLLICADVMWRRDQKRQQKALLDGIARTLVSKADAYRAWTGKPS